MSSALASRRARPPFLVPLAPLPHRTYVEKTAQLDARHPATVVMDKRQKNRTLVSARISCQDGLQTPACTHTNTRNVQGA